MWHRLEAEVVGEDVVDPLRMSNPRYRPSCQRKELVVAVDVAQVVLRMRMQGHPPLLTPSSESPIMKYTTARTVLALMMRRRIPKLL